MIQTKLPGGGFNGTWKFHAEKPSIHPPKILNEFFQDGIRMYNCEDNRLFIAKDYDYNFLTQRKCVSIAIIP